MAVMNKAEYIAEVRRQALSRQIEHEKGKTIQTLDQWIVENNPRFAFADIDEYDLFTGLPIKRKGELIS